MFSSFRNQRTASFRRASRSLCKPHKYAGGVQKKNLQLEKPYGISLRSGLTSTIKCRNCCGSSLGFVDESSTSKTQSCDAELGPSGKQKRKKSLSLPTVSLPAELQTALDKAMSKYPRKSLVQDGQAMLKHLMMRNNRRNKMKSENKIVLETLWNDEEKKAKKGHVELTLRYGKREAMAYAASHVQGCYGTVLRVLSEIARQDPSFKPETLLDFGSGLGTVSWAAHQLWSDTLNEYQCIDISQCMGDLAKALRTGGEIPESDAPPAGLPKEHIPHVYFKQYLPVSNKIQYDLVVAAHTLGDLPSSKLRQLSIASLWRKTKHYLVLVELGNWPGFEIIHQSRELVLEASTKWIKYDDETDEELEGHVFAPCPHDLTCPLSSDSKKPCHFAQRVQLALCQKDGPLRHKGFHQENFSYVVLKKGKRECQSSLARLLQPVKKRTHHIICDLCTPEGEAKRCIYTKRKHGSLYKEGRQSEWGDTLPMSTRSASNYQL